MQRNSQENVEYYDSITAKLPISLLELSADLKTMFEKQMNTDFVLRVEENHIFCHRAILSGRSKWFNFQITIPNQEPVTFIIMKESGKIVDALLAYMYTGNLCLIDALKVPLLDLYNAASRYGLSKLEKLLFRVIKSVENPGMRTSQEFSMEFDTSDFSSCEYSCPFLVPFSIDGTEKWYLRMRLFGNPEESYISLYMRRLSDTPMKNIGHIVNFEMNAIDASGQKRYSYVGFEIFKEDCEKKVTEYISLTRLFENAKDIPTNYKCSLFFELKISPEDFTSPTRFEIKREIERDVTNEFHVLSRDMHKLLKAQKFCDILILLQRSTSLRLHSSIIYARSQIPSTFYGNMSDLGCFGNIVWRSFVYYMYTGQGRYLEDHMREIYIAVCKHQLSEAKKIYSNILSNNLTVCNVHGIKIDAEAFIDDDLMHSALRFIDNDKVN